MNLQKTLKFGILTLALALVVAAAPANAQQVYKATFDLPFEAQVGKVVLEPGNYTLTVEEFAGQRVIRLHGAGEISILALPPARGPVTDKGRLTFVNVNGVYALQKFDNGIFGQTYTFPVYKVKGEQAALNGETTDVVVSTR
jgi:hypothetical protein